MNRLLWLSVRSALLALAEQDDAFLAELRRGLFTAIRGNGVADLRKGLHSMAATIGRKYPPDAEVEAQVVRRNVKREARQHKSAVV